MRVHIEYAQAYELLMSLFAFADLKNHQRLDLGSEWGTRVEEQVGQDFVRELTEAGYAKTSWVLELLAWQCPGAKDVDGFLWWLGGLSVGEIYELLAPYSEAKVRPIPPDLKSRRDMSLRLLNHWNDAYFKGFDPGIAARLKIDAEEKRQWAERMSITELVEVATNGIVLDPVVSRDLVVLAPQYHFSPWNVSLTLQGLKVIFYAADVAPTEAGEPSTGLLRLTRGLADESRLRILRYVAGERRTFTDLVRFTGLAKSTVHQHMVLLRASGLVRMHEAEDGSISYSLRTDGVDSLGDRLSSYFMSGKGEG
jgi:DNA-binding transcriptional ArsR family regulator